MYKHKENFVILQSIGIIVIESSETRAVIYTCRHSSGQFNPEFSPLAELYVLKCPLEYLQVYMIAFVSLPLLL